MIVGVVEADHLSLVAQQLAREGLDPDPALGADDEVDREADEIRESREDALPLLRRHGRAARQERRVVAGRERLGLALHLLDRSAGGEGA